LHKISTEIKWALIFSVATLAWMLAEKVSGLHDRYIDYQMYLTLLFLIPAVWIYLLALKNKRKKDYGGRFTYFQGFVSGFFLTIFITLLSPLTQWVTSFVITPGYFNTVIQRSVELGYYPSEEEAKAYFNFKNYIKGSMTFSFFFGMTTTAVLMLFLRNKKSREFE